MDASSKREPRRRAKAKAERNASSTPATPKEARAARQTKRREAILDAALEEFATRGFAATRLDDVARRAAVAKGTIYLYFDDKESLFQELVRTMLGPIVSRLEAAPAIDLPARVLAETVAELFVREIFGSRRKDVIRLIIAE